MAKEEKRKRDDEEEEQEQEEQKPKGGNKKLIIIIAVVVIVLILGGVGAFFALSGKKASSKATTGEAAATEAEAPEAEAEGEAAEGEGGKVEASLFPLETFIVNLQVKGSFLKTDMQLEFKNGEDVKKAEKEVPRLRDTVIRILSSKTATEILASEGKEKLKDEVRTAVNELLGEEKVLEVYFTEFIIQ